MIQFLIDECLTPALVEVANRFGFVAHHVQDRKWKNKADSELLRYAPAEGLTLVTNNWSDFGLMLRGRYSMRALSWSPTSPELSSSPPWSAPSEQSRHRIRP